MSLFLKKKKQPKIVGILCVNVLSFLICNEYTVLGI